MYNNLLNVDLLDIENVQNWKPFESIKQWISCRSCIKFQQFTHESVQVLSKQEWLAWMIYDIWAKSLPPEQKTKL